MELTQKKYQSIERHGKSGTHLTIEGEPYIVIQEKIDGANASFQRVGDKILAFSRNTLLDESNNLRGFYEWTQTLDIEKIHYGSIFFGEWTAKHKLDYGDNHNKFYLFDEYDTYTEKYMPFDEVKKVADIFGIETVPVFYEGKFQSLEHIQSFVGKSVLGEIGEGVVVKNYNYTNKYGAQVFTKFVSDHFAEVTKTKQHKVKADPLTEFINSTLTEARVSKLIHKLVDEGKLNEDYAIEDMGEILKGLGSSVFDDIIKEELDELLKVVKGRVGKAVPNIVKEVLAKNGRA